jgi:beta-galactosidase
MYRYSLVWLILVVCIAARAQGQPHTRVDFNAGWKFFLGDDGKAKEPGYSDAKWRSLTLPHDWSI